VIDNPRAQLSGFFSCIEQHLRPAQLLAQRAIRPVGRFTADDVCNTEIDELTFAL